MGVLALITFANVVLRYLTDESIAWTEEISISMMVIMTLAAAAAAVARERHTASTTSWNAGPRAVDACSR